LVFSKAQNIPDIFRTIFKDAFLPYRDPETLNLFLKEINYFDYDHSENLGNAFEYLESYNIILANPPFMTPKGGIRPHNRFSVQTKRSEVLFVDYIAEHLNLKTKITEVWGGVTNLGFGLRIIFQNRNQAKLC
jgi:hypothetical protein